MRYLDKVPIMGIIRGAETAQVEGAVTAAMQAGLRTIEITLNHPDAMKQIKRISAGFADQIELGAGTVLDADSAKKAVASGAEFIVTPAFIPEVAKFCRKRSIPFFPGAMTPTEILAAHQAGAEMVKIFPAAILGPNFIRNLKAPFPDIPLMAVGGMNVSNTQDYIQAGVDAIGISTGLFRKDWLEREDWTSINQVASVYVQAVKALI